VSGAAWSAYRFARQRNVTVAAGKISPRRMAVANALIAVGTVVLSAGGLFNSVVDEMDAFALSLVIGISIIFGGFLLTSTRSSTKPTGDVPLWYPPEPLATRLAERSAKDLAGQTLR
jgi:hypothetical protein